MSASYRYIYSMKRLRVVTVILLMAVFCVVALGCSSAAKDAKALRTDASEPSLPTNGPSGDASDKSEGNVIPQGGSLIRDDASEEIPSTEETTGSESSDDENKGADTDEAEDTPYSTFQEVRPKVSHPQFNRQSYETLQPTVEMARKAIEGYFMIDVAEFIADECRLLKGDRFETYELLLRVEGAENYRDVVETYANKLQEEYHRKDWTTKTGHATSFRIEQNDWNKVISIFRRDGEPFIDIRVTFRRLYEN